MCFFLRGKVWASECFNKRGHREYRVYIYAHFHFYLPTHLIYTSVFYIFLCKRIYHNSQKSIFRVQPRSPSVLLMFISTWAGKKFPIQFCTFHEKKCLQIHYFIECMIVGSKLSIFMPIFVFADVYLLYMWLYSVYVYSVHTVLNICALCSIETIVFYGTYLAFE